MELNDTARVRQPADPIEHRLATVTDLFTNGSTTYIQRYELRFPNGETRMYPPQAVVACTRADDHTALVTAVTDTCRSLRDACRIAHDYDDKLSTDSSACSWPSTGSRNPASGSPSTRPTSTRRPTPSR